MWSYYEFVYVYKLIIQNASKSTNLNATKSIESFMSEFNIHVRDKSLGLCAGRS